MPAFSLLLVALQISAAIAPAQQDVLLQGVVTAVQAAAASPERLRGRLMVDAGNFRTASGAGATATVEFPPAWGTYDLEAFDRCVRDESGDSAPPCFRANEVYVRIARVDRSPSGTLTVAGHVRTLRALPVPEEATLPVGASRFTRGQIFLVELVQHNGAWDVKGLSFINIH